MAALAALPGWVLPTVGALSAPFLLGAVKGSRAKSASEDKKTEAAKTSVEQVQDRAEERAEAQTREETARLAARKRARRTGGMRLLMSPNRTPGSSASGTRTKLGPGG
jgi:hypothetical protein